MTTLLTSISEPLFSDAHPGYAGEDSVDEKIPLGGDDTVEDAPIGAGVNAPDVNAPTEKFISQPYVLGSVVLMVVLAIVVLLMRRRQKRQQASRFEKASI